MNRKSPGTGTAAHVKSGWRDPAYEWIAVYQTGRPDPRWVRGVRLADWNRADPNEEREQSA